MFNKNAIPRHDSHTCLMLGVGNGLPHASWAPKTKLACPRHCLAEVGLSWPGRGAWVGSIRRATLGLDMDQLARSKIPIFGPEVAHMLVNNMVVQVVEKESGKVEKSEGQHGHPLSHRGPGFGS